MDGRVRAALLAAFAVGLAASITLSETALALLTVRWLLRLARGRAGPTVPRSVLIALGAFAATTVLAALTAARPLESLVACKSLLLAAALLAISDALEDVGGASRFLRLLFWCLVAVSAVAVLQAALCPWLPSVMSSMGRLVGECDGGSGCGIAGRFVAFAGRLARRCERARGFYSIYMTLAGVLSLVLLATLPWVMRAGARGRAGVARAAAWLLVLAALALTQVRGAWLGFAAGLGLALVFVPRSRRAALAGVGALVVVLLFVPAVRHRLESMGDPTDPTARDRLAMWQSGAAMVRDHPITGIGPGQVKHLYPAYVVPGALRTSRGHLHDTPLQILVERGVLGLAGWLWVFLAFFLAARRRLAGLRPDDPGRGLVVGSLAAIGAFLVGGLTEYNFGDSEVVLIAYVVMALAFVPAREPIAGQRPPMACGHPGG